MVTVYAIGSNGSGQLGIGHKEDVSVPKQVLFHEENIDPITLVQAGGNHTLLLTSESLYCAGDPSSGACGLTFGSKCSDTQFYRVRLSTEDSASSAPVVFCAASWEASIIVQKDEDGHATKVSSFGIGNKGELGLGELLFRIFQSSGHQRISPTGPRGC